jgi:ABC-2 family transporter protein
MIWLTWRQFRPQAIVAGVALAAVAVTLAVTGPHLAALYNDNGLGSCAADCGSRVTSFIDQVRGSASEDIFYGGIFLVYVVPTLVGLFWGAPLVTREIESGTFRLAWNQSVMRRRWVATKLGLVGLASMAAAGLLSLMMSWWASPLYRAAQQATGNSLSISRLAPSLFGATGVAPIGYAALAFALGVTAGLLVRRTIAAMAITLAVFVAIQVLWPIFVRPHLIAPAHTVQALNAVTWNGTGDVNQGHLILVPGSVGGLPPGTWITGSQPVNSAGTPVTMAPPACVSASNFVQCLQNHGVRMEFTYQAADRYWDFQWLETGIFLVLAAGLGGVCYWRVRRLA